MSFTLARFVMLTILTGCLIFPNPNYGMDELLRTDTIPIQITHLSLKRNKPLRGVVIGELFLNGKHEAWTLEDTDTLIPTGTYRVTSHYSAKLRYIVPLIHVSGRTNIYIHKGNTEDDTKGCIVVGISHTDKSVIGSRGAFKRLMSHLTFPASISVQSY